MTATPSGDIEQLPGGSRRAKVYPGTDPDKAGHQHLAALAGRAEQVAAEVGLPAVRFGALRRRVQGRKRVLPSPPW